MTDPIRVPRSAAELRHELSMLKLKIALLECQEKELDSIAEEAEDSEVVLEMCKTHTPLVLRQIDHALKRLRVRHAIHEILPRVAKTAACLLLVFYLGLSVAVASVQSIRIGVLNFITRIEDRYTSFGFEASETVVNVPAGWEGYYFPSDIPDNFMPTLITANEVDYVRGDGTMLDFCEMGSEGCGTIDTENAVLDYTSIHGNSAFVVEKDSWTTILWNIDNRCLMLNYTGERDEAISIAESVRMIRN